jgi:hypothetical protein
MPKQVWNKRTSSFPVYSLAISAMVFSALYRTMDNITVRSFITHEDTVTAVLVYFTLGSWVCIFSSIIFMYLLGRKLIDRDFKKIYLPQKWTIFWAFAAGSVGALATFFNLWGNKYLDPGTSIALGNILVVFIAVYDLIHKEIRLKKIALSLVLVVMGATIASYSGSLKITLLGLFLIGVVSNILFAISEIAEQKGVRQTDGVNFFFWRFLNFTITATVATILICLIRGKVKLYWEILSNSVRFVPWIVLTMFFVFLGMALKLTAKKKGIMSIVLMILSFQIVLGYFFTFVGVKISPGLFEGITRNGSVWLVRLLGASLLLIGLIRLRNIRR